VKIARLLGHGLRHMTLDELVECLHELVGSVIEVQVRGGADEVVHDRSARPHTKVGSFLAPLERDHDAETGELIYEFSKTLRYVFARSSYWVVLDRRATLAFESRYAIRLYEMIALRGRLEHTSSETFAIEDLRARLGVPEGKLPRWQDFKRKVLEAAVAEVNHLSAFDVEWAPIKHGRAVAAVSLTWKAKAGPARLAVARELTRTRTGRRGRRLGLEVEPTPATGPTVEIVSPSFPAAGSIAYSRWAELVRRHAPSPTPDVDLVAERLRALAWPLAPGEGHREGVRRLRREVPGGVSHDVEHGRLGRYQDEVGHRGRLEGDVLGEWRRVDDGEIRRAAARSLHHVREARRGQGGGGEVLRRAVVGPERGRGLWVEVEQHRAQARPSRAYPQRCRQRRLTDPHPSAR
jgi:hypothetical protein